MSTLPKFDFKGSDLNAEQRNFLLAIAQIYQGPQGAEIIAEAFGNIHARLKAESEMILHGAGFSVKLHNGVSQEEMIDGLAQLLAVYKDLAEIHLSPENFPQLLNTWTSSLTFAKSYMDFGVDSRGFRTAALSEVDIKNYTAVDWSQPAIEAGIAAMRTQTKLRAFVNEKAEPPAIIELFIDGIDAALKKRDAGDAERHKIATTLRGAFPELAEKEFQKRLDANVSALHKLPYEQKMALVSRLVEEAGEGPEKNYLRGLAGVFAAEGEGFVTRVLGRMQQRFETMRSEICSELKLLTGEKAHKFPQSPRDVAAKAFSYFSETLDVLCKDNMFFFNHMITWAGNAKYFGVMGFRGMESPRAEVNGMGDVNSTPGLITYNISNPLSSVWVKQARQISQRIFPRQPLPLPANGVFKTSLAEIMISAVVDELKATRTANNAQAQIAQVERQLYAAFPDLEAQRYRPQKPGKQQALATSAPIFRNYDLPSNAKYLITLTNRQRGILAAGAGSEAEFGGRNNFDLPEARSLIAFESAKALPKNSPQEGRFLLAARFTNGIEDLTSRFNAQKNDTLRAEMDLLLSDQNLARLVHHSGLCADFPEIKTPKPGNGKSKDISPEFAKLLVDADAGFLLAAHRQEQEKLSKLGAAANQIAVSGQSFGFHHMSRLISKTAEALAFPQKPKS